MSNQSVNNSKWIESLCMESWRDIYRFIYYKVQNREEAEDITQETYLKALVHFKKNDTVISDYTNYLKTIAMNIIRDRWRARLGKSIGIPLDDVIEQELSSEDFTERLGEKTLLKEAMAKLPTEQCTVIKLRIIEGYSTKETAKLMNKKEGTIRVIQYRAVKLLSDLLTELQGR